MRNQFTGLQSCAAQTIERYVIYKRALNHRYRSEERELRLMDRFLFERRVERIEEICPETIGEFLASRPRQHPRSYNHLLGVVRCFFEWLVAQGRLTISPVQARPRRTTSERIPFIFRPEQARSLLEVAETLPERSGAPLRGPTYRTIFGLLYGLGLRVGEVSRLCCKDVDLGRRLLIIRETKFSKSRLVPFGPHIASMMQKYLQLRLETGAVLSEDAPFFSFRRGRPINPETISVTFHQLWPRLGLIVPAGVAPPRVHDLRHAFAVGTLLRWYREGIDPATRLLHLSTFLGHVNPSSTAVYLTITAELFEEANQRFERFASAAIAGVVS